MKTNNLPPILLVEDDQVDIMIVKRSFKELGVLNNLIVTHDGEEAIKYLKEADEDLPCTILLDINMPRMNGHEFLLFLKQDKKFNDIPVIMLTSSKELEDVHRCTQLNITGYVIKPVNYGEFNTSIQILKPYWTLKNPL